MGFFDRLFGGGTSSLLIAVCLSATAVPAQTKSPRHVDTSSYVILQYDKRTDKVFDQSDHPRATTLFPAEVDNMEPLVDSAFQRLFRKLPANYQGKSPLGAYKRKYIAIINSKGQKEVWIGFFCETPKAWRKREVIVEDGGACFLYLLLNLTFRKVPKMEVNGMA
jgi:hypothetical protein